MKANRPGKQILRLIVASIVVTLLVTSCASSTIATATTVPIHDLYAVIKTKNAILHIAPLQASTTVTVTNSDKTAHEFDIKANFYRSVPQQLSANGDLIVATATGHYLLAAGERQDLTFSSAKKDTDPVVYVDFDVRGR